MYEGWLLHGSDLVGALLVPVLTLGHAPTYLVTTTLKRNILVVPKLCNILRQNGFAFLVENPQNISQTSAISPRKFLVKSEVKTSAFINKYGEGKGKEVRLFRILIILPDTGYPAGPITGYSG